MSANKPILVTGAAGFIGFHLAKRLLDDGRHVAGVDSLNRYYSQKLKRDRLAILRQYGGFTFHKLNIDNRRDIEDLFRRYAADVPVHPPGSSVEKQPEPMNRQPFDYIVHLAAQAGVRYSITNPYVYVESNIRGFLNILEACRHYGAGHLVFASSSSVYGANTKMPFSVHHNVDHPVSLYAATKKANELMAHTYATLYGIPVTGLRFFTVYGPWGRPDMSYFLFTKAIVDGRAIDVFNNGRMKRDFTYVDDIVEGIVRVMGRPPQPNRDWTGDMPDPATSFAPYRLYNIGNNSPVDLLYFIGIIEKALGKKAVKNLLPLQAGDVPETCADVDDLARDTGFKPVTSIEEGIGKFIAWYRDYYRE